MMRTKIPTSQSLLIMGALLLLLLTGILRAEHRYALADTQSVEAKKHDAARPAPPVATTHRAPFLGSDLVWADGPHVVIEAWQNQAMGAAFYQALQNAGVRSLRLNFAAIYSPRGVQASAALKAENKTTNEYPWFPFSDYANFIAAHDLTTVVGINVEEGADTAAEVIGKFAADGMRAKLIAVELSNEPWLNHRPWQPEEYAARAADVIERLTPMRVKFALPLTVGDSRNTPTKLSDTEWNTRMMRALSLRIDLKSRTDIYGVLHLYAGGVRAKSVDYFNRIVRPFAPQMRYLVTEFNIRLSLEGNPHLTNKYGLEFARKLAELMNVADLEALYVHAVPYHSILYWTNRKQVSTVIGGRDAKLKDEDKTQGWHLTPAGRVYALYSKVAWNGEVVFYQEDGKQRYWAVKSPTGALVITLLNEKAQAVSKRITFFGNSVKVTAPPQSIVCVDDSGRELDKVSLPF
ncbi:MAG: hypothetical protein HY231_14290 [Acidobacteria bacterium]|nr:hypothetical protein [Acidobacteriota bacterium]